MGITRIGDGVMVVETIGGGVKEMVSYQKILLIPPLDFDFVGYASRTIYSLEYKYAGVNIGLCRALYPVREV